MPTFKLLPIHIEALEHRLSAPDAIDDRFTDEDEPKWSSGQVAEGIEEVEVQVASGEINFDALSPCGVDVLVDCIDGSTFFATMNDAVDNGEVTRGTFNSRYKACSRLAEWVSDQTGSAVEFSKF